MTGPNKVFHQAPADSFSLLKPKKLGTHFHKVPHYITTLSSKHPKIFNDYFLRHYRLNIDLCNVIVHEHFDNKPECLLNSINGDFGFTIERTLLSEVLECYYGGTAMGTQDSAPVSSSEDRMRNRLALDITAIVIRMLLGDEAPNDLQPQVNTYVETTWEYMVEFQYSSSALGTMSSIFLHVDSLVIDELTRRLSDRAPVSTTNSPVSRIKHLPVRLDCVLVNLQIPLSGVLALKIGDILLVRLLDQCEVQINQQKLFRGSLCEDNGSLFLTSLHSVKKS